MVKCVNLYGNNSDIILFKDGKVIEENTNKELQTREIDGKVYLFRMISGVPTNINITNALKVHFGNNRHNKFRNVKNSSYLMTNGYRILDTNKYQITAIKDMQKFILLDIILKIYENVLSNSLNF